MESYFSGENVILCKTNRMNNRSLHSIDNWVAELTDAFLNSKNIFVALFSEAGELLFANNVMGKILNEGTFKSFIKPILNEKSDTIKSSSKIFEGYITLGDGVNKRHKLFGKIYRKNDSILLICEEDVERLTEQNLVMRRLNTEISDLQGQLINQKVTLEQTLFQLKELNTSKDRFFSIISHDLKNSFSTILGFLEILKDSIHKLDREKLELFFGKLLLTASLTYDLLDNLLIWAKSQRSGLKFVPFEFHLKPLIVENIQLYEKMATEKNIQVNTDIDENVIVYADKEMLKTIFRNLLTNAIKFTYAGGQVNVTAVLKAGMMHISISDTGMGISEEDLKRLFKIDDQISQKGTQNEMGNGLGLIICKEFVEKHGGKIWVESIVNEGSIFQFTLPVSYK
jgi:signal transduction histidine kinase